MNNPLTKYLTILIVFVSNLSAQVPDSVQNENLYPFIVDSIRISGNEITEDFIILRELTFTAGDTLDFKTIFYNRERIYSLGLFAHVFVYPIVENNINIIEIVVEERWYIYPIPFVNIKERDIKKLSFGIFLRWDNFRGRNEQINAFAAFGYDPSFGLNYYNPNLIGNEEFFLRVGFTYSNINNKSPSAEQIYGGQFSQKFFRPFLMFGKRLFLFHRFYSVLAFNYLETDKYFDGINVSGERIDRFPEIQLGYEFDSRDLIQFPREGIFASATYSFKGMGFNSIDYKVARFDFREYRKILGDLYSKWRFSGRFTFGNNIPFYDYSIIGFEDRIRGYFTRKIEGNHFYFSSVEFFYPLIEELNIDLDFIPIIPEQLLKYRVALYTQIFGDAGTAFYKNQALSLNRFKSGYGIGITFLVLPYNLLRIEYAFDNFGKTEWILDLGVAF